MNDSESPDTRARYWRTQIDAWQASGWCAWGFVTLGPAAIGSILWRLPRK